MKYLLLVSFLFSCQMVKRITKCRKAGIEMTHQQQTDSIVLFSKRFGQIQKDYVYLDTNFFMVTKGGVATLKDSIVFQVGTFRRLYVGIDDSIHLPLDTKK